VEYSVKLARLPEQVVFPARLGDRVVYDAARGQLIYRGFMTKCTYDELSGLSDDVEYHRALEQLFVLTSAEMAPPSKRVGPAVVAAAVGAMALAAGAIWFAARGGAPDKPQPQEPGVVLSTAAQ
jgi:hypothetical protein